MNWYKKSQQNPINDVLIAELENKSVFMREHDKRIMKLPTKLYYIGGTDGHPYYLRFNSDPPFNLTMWALHTMKENEETVNLFNVKWRLKNLEQIYYETQKYIDEHQELSKMESVTLEDIEDLL